MNCQNPDERAERGSERIVRRHHQHVHVIGDFLVGQRAAIVQRRPAQFRQQILAIAVAARPDQLDEMVDKPRARLDATPHSGQRKRRSHPADSRRHFGDESLV
jgi:hypothetical protein